MLFSLILLKDPYDHRHNKGKTEGGFTKVDEHLLDMMCHSAFERQIAEVTIEIGKPRVIEIVKDIKVTFPDMLGTIGI